ncbi:hypothetical protein L226DRAFT_510120 [Lentinus tigrinus ALCF2SS1-7]|uniref:Uncharacterized protein n=1 Tax=Lentinus tigrinus ALCF2SS1-6 TaxID=1328759 RepID=A0A5C2RSN0_9APHY|nr:hypothetical protein L227DRAFT_556684 [Lentinus tigrinus ALCF2SS1-6]RPD73819.1 hypothetical protein L226DRAFT_510120 [Lentinus tigrinus ALCF2SS1-7]
MSTTRVFAEAGRAVEGAARGLHTHNKKKAAKAANKADDAVSGAQLLVTASGGVRDGTASLVDSVLPLVSALQAVAKIHPWLEVVVNAFQVVVELNMRRRANDRKIGLLIGSMRDMMESLRSLETVPAEKARAVNGTSIKTRLEDLVAQTAEDIKACASACDVYSKTRLLTKVLRSMTWDDLFKQYIELFERRRADFILRISVHSGLVLEDAHHALQGIDEKVKELVRTVAEPSPEEQRLREIVERKGGAEAIASDDALLREVLRAEPRVAGDHESELNSDSLATVKAELLESAAEAVERNSEVFRRKFRLQEMKIVEELTRVSHAEGDRIIESVLDGPHNAIHNPDIRHIWADAGWRGRVKSRHFFSALYDHCRGLLAAARSAASAMPSSDTAATLKLLNLSRLQRVAEAIDVDATGFITVVAVNQFTDSRPESWRRAFLLEWIAYWAVGWEDQMTAYRDKIDEIIAKMFYLRRRIRMVDEEVLEIYLRGVHEEVEALTRAFRPELISVPPGLAKLFLERENAVEGLETVRYLIDAPDTLSLIIGPGRVEEKIFPTLYLLLSRDLQVFRLCQTKYVSPEELILSWHSLVIVCGEVNERYCHLKDVFEYRPDPSSESFKQFAYGMFAYWHDQKKLWSLKICEEDPFLEIPVNEEEEAPLDATILNFPLATDHLYPPAQESVTTHTEEASVKLAGILGTWNGFFYNELDKPGASMYSFNLRPADSDGLASYIARGCVSHRGSEFVITGNVEHDEAGRPIYELWLRFVPSHYENFNVYFRGNLHLEGSVFAGVWGMVKNDMPNFFQFRRISPELLVCRPPPEHFRMNQAAARWSFALTAVHTEVLRKLSSTRLLEQRRAKRRQWEAFLAGDTNVDISELFRTTTYADACYYFAVLRSRNVIHKLPSYYCDQCDAKIMGARILCLECGIDDTVDFCDKPECMGVVVRLKDLPEPHLPSHDVAKLRAIAITRESGKVLKASKAALSRARGLLDRDEQLATRRQSSMSTAPVCIGCARIVHYPCWFCSDCEGSSLRYIYH